MSRLESSNEPSMEEILASIRKIIAEDPPGSRNRPDLSAQQSSASVRPALDRAIFMRDAGFSPSTPAAKSANQDFSSQASSDDKHDAEADDSIFQSKPARSNGASPASTIEAQLSDLLGDDLAALDAKEAEPRANDTATFVNAEVDGESPLVSTLTASLEKVREDGASSEGARPGFTVTRDGFVPASDAGAAKREGYNFDLGPSPFEPRPLAASTFRSSEAAFADLGSVVPRRRDVLETASSRPDDVSSSSEHRTDETFTEALAVTTPILAAPSVAATLPPQSRSSSIGSMYSSAHQSERNTDTHASFVSGISDAVTADSRPASPSQFVAVQVLENPVMLDVVDSPQSVHPVAVREHMGSSGDTLASAHDVLMSRTIEDTVADLLRPMLKTWLAENMPKIVERALRREISEIAAAQHKTAAE